MGHNAVSTRLQGNMFVDLVVIAVFGKRCERIAVVYPFQNDYVLDLVYRLEIFSFIIINIRASWYRIVKAVISYL